MIYNVQQSLKSFKTLLTHLIADHQALLQSAYKDADGILLPKTRDLLGSSCCFRLKLPIPIFRLSKVYMQDTDR